MGPVDQAALSLVTDWPRSPGADIIDGSGGVTVEHAETDTRLLVCEVLALLE